jgi:hypothetical protein
MGRGSSDGGGPYPNHVWTQPLHAAPSGSDRSHTESSSGETPDSSSGQTVYVVEFRNRRAKTTWQKYGEYHSRSQADTALRRLQMTRRPPGWECRVRVEHNGGVNSSDSNSQTTAQPSRRRFNPLRRFRAMAGPR